MSVKESKYNFDIAFSLLHKDLPYAQSIYDELGQYNLKTFLYQHNQKELAIIMEYLSFPRFLKLKQGSLFFFTEKGMEKLIGQKLSILQFRKDIYQRGQIFVF
jgi:hypothetical protein